jgi:hypothetical protein
MELVCDGDAAKVLTFVSVDEGVVCECDCTSCSSTETTCNESGEIKKIYDGISRESFVLSEDISFEEGRAPITP